MLDEERTLIESLAARLKQAPPPSTEEKDSEAEALINQQIASQKDVVYRLTQAVLMQEHALKEAQNQLQQLRRAVDRPAKKSSFLGGLFSAGKPSPTTQHSATSTLNSGVASGSAPAGSTPTLSQAPSQSAGAGQSFLKSAASSAVGVAGGMMLFQGISSLFGHGSQSAPQQIINETYINEDSNNDSSYDDSDRGSYDDGALSEDSSFDDGGGFDGGFDGGGFDDGGFDDSW